LIEPVFPVYKDGMVVLGSKENGSMIVPEGEVRVEENDPWVDEWTRQRCRWWGEARYWDGYEGNEDADVKRNGKGRKVKAEWKVKNKETFRPIVEEDVSDRAGNGQKMDAKNIQWHAEWKAEWVAKDEKVVKSSVQKEVADDIGSDGKNDEVDGKEELR
jgi:hypothetical protein